jgi:putative transposase
MDDARSRIEAWRLDYNQVRPHSRLDNLTPSEFALRHNPVASDAA